MICNMKLLYVTIKIFIYTEGLFDDVCLIALQKGKKKKTNLILGFDKHKLVGFGSRKFSLTKVEVSNDIIGHWQLNFQRWTKCDLGGTILRFQFRLDCVLLPSVFVSIKKHTK